MRHLRPWRDPCAMGKPHDEITEAELSVMEVLWDCETGETIREIVLVVYGRHEHSLHAGVKSFLDRLIEKGYARVDKAAFAHRFFAAVTRQQYIGRQLRAWRKAILAARLRRCCCRWSSKQSFPKKIVRRSKSSSRTSENKGRQPWPTCST